MFSGRVSSGMYPRMRMRSKQWYTKASRLPNSVVNSSIAAPSVDAHCIGTQEQSKWVACGSSAGRGNDRCRARTSAWLMKSVISNDELLSDSRIVSIAPLLLFSTETGDAWMLDPADHLATPIARQGTALSVHIQDRDRNFTVEWAGNYQIDGDLFLYREKDSGNTRTIFGYPTARIRSKYRQRLAEA